METTNHMFKSTVTKIRFAYLINFAKSILLKSEKNVKWFLFGYIYIKVVE